MKRLINFAAAAVLVLGLTGAAILADNGAVAASAEETSHITTAAQTTGTLAPFAWYTFDSEETLGKDRMGHFDLKMKVNGSGAYEVREDTEKGFKYVALRRNKDVMDVDPTDRETYDQTKSTNGVLFYAPNMDKTGYDMSDLIGNSYTLTITFRAYVPSDYGAAQLLCTGRYSDSTTITPWQTGVTVQPTTKWMLGKEVEQGTIDSWRKPVALERTVWNTLTLVGDSEAKKVNCYLNGQLADSWDVDPVKFTNQNMDGALGADYTFAIGGSAARDGSGLEQFSDSDVKECMVFDYALSADNVAALYAGNDVSFAGDKVESVPELNTDDVNFSLSDQNTLSDVRNKLPSSATVTLASGGKAKANIFWTTAETSDTLYGVIQPSMGANVKGFAYKYVCNFILKFSYDKTAITISDVKLGQKTMNPDEVNVLDTSDALASRSLSFKVEPKDGCSITGVMYDDIDWFSESDWAGDDEGYVYITVKNGCEIVVLSSGGSGGGTSSSVPSGGGSASASTSGGGSGGGTSSSVSSDGGSGDGEKSGCGSSLAVGAALCSVIAAGALVVLAKKKN